MEARAQGGPGRRDTRGRLLEAADRLFYTGGIHATGVDAVVAEAGVARMSLYNHFGGKAGLVASYLEERDIRWRADLEQAIAAAGSDPIARLLAVFDAVAQWVADPGFRGCGFANAVAELADQDHPAHHVAARQRQDLRHRLTELAVAAELAKPERLVDQLMVLCEGCLTAAAVGSVDDAVDTARATAHHLLWLHS